MKVEYLEKELHNMDPNLKGEDFSLGIIMLSSTLVGTSEKSLSKFTGYNYLIVRKFINDLKRAGIFKAGKVHNSGWF